MLPSVIGVPGGCMFVERLELDRVASQTAEHVVKTKVVATPATIKPRIRNLVRPNESATKDITL
jgi:hypothetical protein